MCWSESGLASSIDQMCCPWTEWHRSATDWPAIDSSIDMHWTRSFVPTLNWKCRMPHCCEKWRLTQAASSLGCLMSSVLWLPHLNCSQTVAAAAAAAAAVELLHPHTDYHSPCRNFESNYCSGMSCSGWGTASWCLNMCSPRADETDSQPDRRSCCADRAPSRSRLAIVCRQRPPRACAWWRCVGVGLGGVLSRSRASPHFASGIALSPQYAQSPCVFLTVSRLFNTTRATPAQSSQSHRVASKPSGTAQAAGSA